MRIANKIGVWRPCPVRCWGEIPVKTFIWGLIRNSQTPGQPPLYGLYRISVIFFPIRAAFGLNREFHRARLHRE